MHMYTNMYKNKQYAVYVCIQYSFSCVEGGNNKTVGHHDVIENLCQNS